MKIPFKRNEKSELVVAVEINTKPLQEKLGLLFNLEASLFEDVIHHVNSNLSSLSLNFGIEYGNITTIDYITTSGADGIEKLVMVVDLDIVRFIKEWIVALRAGESY